jgi:hypothetical protein
VTAATTMDRSGSRWLERGVGRDPPGVDQVLQLTRGDVADVALASVDRVDDLTLHVPEQHVVARVGEDLRQRHTHVARPDDCDIRFHPAQGY